MQEDNPNEPNEPTEPEPARPEPARAKAMAQRFTAIPSRTKLLIATGVVLLIIVMFFQSCQNVEVKREEALATARSRVDFAGVEPERAEAKLIRQGIPTTAQWVVVFRIQDPEGGSEDFLCHASVYIDATTGELTRDANLGESAEDCPWAPAFTA